MVTLADLANLPLPKQALGGESLRPLLLTADGLEMEVSSVFPLLLLVPQSNCQDNHE